MYLKRVQSCVYELFKNSSIGIILMQFSKVLVLVYPIYLILWNFSFLNSIMNIIGTLGAVLYATYGIGLLASFAKNDMIMIGIAFLLKAIDDIISLIMYSFSISTLLYTVLYVILAVWALYKSNSMNY